VRKQNAAEEPELEKILEKRKNQTERERKERA
jgi:hypothetical protein